MRCAVCDNGERQSWRTLLCRACVHPESVRTYCVRCRERMDLTLETAVKLFAHAGLSIDCVGVVLRFNDGCPNCTSDMHGAPDIFTMDLDDFPACQAA